MEDKNKAPQDAPEKTTDHPQVKLMDKEPITVDMEKSPEPVATHIAAPARRSRKFTIIAVVLVVVALLAVLFRLESEGRVDTNIFSGIIAMQEARAPIATVNGVDLTQDELTTAFEQLSEAAAAQGVDFTNPDVQTELRSQATTMLINTELLEQEAEAQGIVISAEALAERMTEIEADAGGPEVFAARLAEFEITRDMLEADVRVELTIRELLDGVLVDEELSVTEEEITEVYTNAGGADAGLPPLDEVRSQIEQSIVQSKEQAAVDQYIESLRSGADIEITAS